ncbi:MAG: hypothetical protein ACSLFJ_07670 [Immundisolibacter sp.]|uniref:hypothetical protein n=1 Tax=Immundisolibacter sp. TaxID=1934948 RepID=UPI003EDFF8D1
MKHHKGLIAIALPLCLGAPLAHAASEAPRLPKGIPGLQQSQAKPPGANWLLDADADQERFRRIQIYAGGTDQQMWQIGYRFEQVYQAIVDHNWALGLHHWGKLRGVLDVALMKRPNRTPNAEALFLDTAWQPLADALRAEDVAQARKAFQSSRDACMSCHVAEEMPFLNDTLIFRNTARFAPD